MGKEIYFKPALIGGRAILFVEATQDGYSDIVRG